jgi:D-sedoheptulose 7-phosphate isomerase
MSDAAVDDVLRYLVQSRDIVAAAIEDAGFINTLAVAGERIAAALAAGGKVLLAGNGGSAADAQHIAGELVGRLNYDRPPLAAIALTTDSSVLTAIANDYSYAEVFERQVRGLGRTGDVLIAISTSGRSGNILRAINTAREMGLCVIGLTGETGGDMASCCDLCLCAPSTVTSLIQQLHIIAAHVICGIVEERLFPRQKS